MSPFLEGATMLASFAVAAFFLRYWRDTRDRLFAVFAAAFALFGGNRIALHLLAADSEARTWVYLLRAAAFLTIIGAVIDKNLPRRADSRPQERQHAATPTSPHDGEDRE